MVTIDLPLYSSLNGGRNWKTVKAELVYDIAPHLAGVATFAVHKIGGNLFANWWRVSNVETGCCIGAADQPTRLGCIEVATQYLKTKTPEQVLKAYEAFKKGQ